MSQSRKTDEISSTLSVGLIFFLLIASLIYNAFNYYYAIGFSLIVIIGFNDIPEKIYNGYTSRREMFESVERPLKYCLHCGVKVLFNVNECPACGQPC